MSLDTTLDLSDAGRGASVGWLTTAGDGTPATIARHVPSKRVLDLIVLFLVAPLLLPLIAIAAIGVKLSSPGPVLFRQPRVGRHGEIFTMLKLRTFPVDHRDVLHSLHSSECPLRWGRFLRRTSIDELPQLWNVLRGDMSIVGPRPERPHFVDELASQVPGYAERHRVPGGITGAAQVAGFWGGSCIEQRVRLDNHYIESWSVWRDVAIIFLTIPAVLWKSRTS